MYACCAIQVRTPSSLLTRDNAVFPQPVVPQRHFRACRGWLVVVIQKEEVLIRLFDEHGLVAVVNGTLIKTFLKSEFNATPLENGATEPALKELLPANTYLVVVPPGRTSTTIAKDVASYCELGGDNIQSFHTRPIAVKVGCLLL